MDDQAIIGIDVGTTKICTLVGRLHAPGQFQILGVGIEPAQGLKKGVVVDLEAATQAIARSVDKAERTSGVEIFSALVSLAGSGVSSQNSNGVVGISGKVIEENDVSRAIDSARAVAIPHNREIVHVVQRGFIIDGQEGIRMPIGMHGYRLEVETHIITASAASMENLRQSIAAAGVDVSQFVLNPLASAEVVLKETERQMGVVVVDIGGGTTDLAIYVDGDVWYTAVIAVGGNHITSDLAQILHLPNSQAEEIKIQHGNADLEVIDPKQYFNIRPFGEEHPVRILHQEVVEIINARVVEVFDLIGQEIKRSGYDGLLPAGIVLTGGSSELPGMRTIANQVLGVPVRLSKPEKLLGMTDQLLSPAYSTSVGLLHWETLMRDVTPTKRTSRVQNVPHISSINWDHIINWMRRLLP
jgi:cell division protein FtsA